MKKFPYFLAFIALWFLILGIIYVFKLPPLFGEISLFGPASQESEKIPTHLSYQTRIEKGDVLFENGYFSLAITEYTLASELEPAIFEPYFKIGQVHFESGGFEKALPNFQTALELDPANPEVQIYLGRTYLAREEFEKAQEIFGTISTENQEAKYYQGILAAYSGDYEKSKTYFKKAVEMGTSEEISKKSQNFLSAYQEFELQEEGQAIYLKTLLGRAFNQSEEYNLAISILYQVLKEKSDYRDAWILLGYAYLKQEKFLDGEKALLEARNLDPSKPETHFLLGLAYFGLENLNEASTELTIALQNGFEPRIQIYQKLAEIYLESGDYEKAVAALESVLQLNDSDVNYFIRPIWIYLEHLKKFEKALELAEKALASHPNEAMAYNLLGWVQVASENFQEGETNLREALKINPDLGAAYLNLGWMDEKESQFDLAKENYQKAYQLNQSDSIGNLAAERYNNLLAQETSD